jgi:hypothetical protein
VRSVEPCPESTDGRERFSFQQPSIAASAVRASVVGNHGEQVERFGGKLDGMEWPAYGLPLVAPATSPVAESDERSLVGFDPFEPERSPVLPAETSMKRSHNDERRVFLLLSHSIAFARKRYPIKPDRGDFERMGVSDALSPIRRPRPAPLPVPCAGCGVHRGALVHRRRRARRAPWCSPGRRVASGLLRSRAWHLEPAWSRSWTRTR